MAAAPRQDVGVVLWLAEELVLLGFTRHEPFRRCWGAPVERMGPTTNRWWAALYAIGSVELSFLVLADSRHGIGLACVVQTVFNDGILVLRGFTRGPNFGGTNARQRSETRTER
jgi:hypothetical protein